MSVNPRAFYAIVWVVLVGATLMEVATRSLLTASSLIIVVIIAIACAKAVLIAVYYQGLRHEPASLALLPLVAFMIIALLAITSLLMASMGRMGM
jgi:caa(3)-type oxidase subunit IV